MAQFASATTSTGQGRASSIAANPKLSPGSRMRATFSSPLARRNVSFAEPSTTATTPGRGSPRLAIVAPRRKSRIWA
jgi:hypothetical protein